MNHVGLSVSNLTRAIAFYRDLLGMELVVQTTFEGEIYDSIMNLKGARGQVALVRKGDLQIELFQFDHPRPRRGQASRPVSDQGISHFCIEVTDIQSEYERLKAAGVLFHSAPQIFEDMWATYARDSDGNVFELLAKP